MGAFFCLVRKINRVSPEILNIVGIDTVRAIMLLSVRAPYSLIFVDIEVMVPCEKVDHLNLNFGLGVGKGAKFLKIAFLTLICVALAEFCFISAWVINLFDLVVRVAALIVFAASLRA